LHHTVTVTVFLKVTAAAAMVQPAKPRVLTTDINYVSMSVNISELTERLANAKVSARQSWYIGRNSLNRPPLRIAQQYQRNLYIIEKYF